MGQRKWGESFLKTGLPLEHLTSSIFKSSNFFCNSSVEIERPNREGQQTWFELDLDATSDFDNHGTYLSFLVECKYHDASRFWFFLPHEPDYRMSDDRVFNCGPVQTLMRSKNSGALKLAVTSSGGALVSEDGSKVDDSVRTAVQQLVNAFIPFCLGEMYNDLLSEPEPESEESSPYASARIPVIVTNATLYRLKKDVTKIDEIRSASEPTAIADIVPWTWYYFEPPLSLVRRNKEAIEKHIDEQAERIFSIPQIKKRLLSFENRPNWIAIVNIEYLQRMIEEITEYFMALPMFLTEDAFVPSKYKTRRKKS